MKNSWSYHLYRASLASFIILVTAVLLGALYDIGQQQVTRTVLSAGKSTRAADILITGGAFILTAVIAGIISVSRLITVKQVLASIPKAYVPIQHDDVPQDAQRLIAREYSRCAMIAHISRPRNRELKGWGKPGTPYEGIQFRRGILDTVNVLETLLSSHLPDQSGKPLDFATASKPLPSPLQKYMPTFFSPPTNLLPIQFKPLLQLYEKRLQDARLAREEPTQEDYEDCLRVVSIVVASVKKTEEGGWMKEGE